MLVAALLCAWLGCAQAQQQLAHAPRRARIEDVRVRVRGAAALDGNVQGRAAGLRSAAANQAGCAPWWQKEQVHVRV